MHTLQHSIPSTSSRSIDHDPLHATGSDSYGSRAFYVAGRHAWNSLPYSVRNPKVTEAVLTRLLKTLLYENITPSALGGSYTDYTNTLYKLTSIDCGVYCITYSVIKWRRKFWSQTGPPGVYVNGKIKPHQSFSGLFRFELHMHGEDKTTDWLRCVMRPVKEKGSWPLNR